MIKGFVPTPKEDFAKIFLDPKVELADLIELSKAEFGLKLPEVITDKQALLDTVYESYLSMIKMYELFQKQNVKKEATAIKGLTKKQWITDYIKTSKQIRYSDLMVAFDNEYGYSIIGKSPRVRIRKTLAELELLNKVIVDNSTNMITWK